MPDNNNVTTKFSVDISELKAGITEANRQIKLANAEFKAAAAGMDDWDKSAEGLQAKLKQLETVIAAETAKLDAYKKQLELVNQSHDESAKKAEELEAAYQAAADAYGENSEEAKKLQKELQGVYKEMASAESAADKLQVTILNQQAKVNSAEKDYRNYSKALDDVEDSADDAADASGDLADAVDDAADSADKSSGGFTVLKGALADLAADGIRAVVDGFKDMLTSGDKALTSFSAKTGIAGDALSGFDDEIQRIYKANLGESLEDVADSMATVAQQSKEVDPTKIGEMTEQALVLRDVFGFDVTESVRTANMLMQQFGISGEQAFNLISQGAQNGLDKNGDMLDTLNEYAVHYEQLGFTAEEFFNSLANGTEAGTFSVDKLGDAMKEFGIRVKDTADSTTEGFELIGLDADSMREKFLAGGDAAKQATNETIQALMSMDDPIKQNQAGVDLFGTMWEDLGKEGVAALADVTGELDMTKASLDEIAETNSSDVGSQFQELGRTIKTDFIQPLAKEALPYLKDFVSFVTTNLPTIVPIVTAAAGAFGAFKAITWITGLVTQIQALITAASAGSGIMAVFGGSISALATPVTAVVAVIGVLVAAFMTLWNTSEDFRSSMTGIATEIKTTWDNFIGGILERINALGFNFQSMTELLSSLWKGFCDLLAPVFEYAFSTVSNVLSTVFGVLTGLLDVFIGLFTGNWSQAWEGNKGIN